MNHNTSLTSPSDKSSDIVPNKTRVSIPALSTSETDKAMEALNDTTFTKNEFRKVERRYVDPPLNLQNFGLFSFVPSRGAVPDKDGFFGFAKLRGNFDTVEESNERAEYLVKNVDSYHKIYHTYVGRPFPITVTSDYSKDVKEIDIHRKMADEISADVKKKREDEKKEITTIKEREKNLQKEVDKENTDPTDIYTTLKTKKAQLSWTYLETLKKVEQMKQSIIKTKEEIEKMDLEDPSLSTMFYDKYMTARKEAGFEDDPDKVSDSFIKYMVEDADLGF